MSIKSISVLSESLARDICKGFLQQDLLIEISYPNKGLNQAAEICYIHSGLYAFLLVKGGVTGIAYVGKSEGDDRLRQHLTGENKDGSVIAGSVGTKHKNIKEALNNGYAVYLALKADSDFTKSTLTCLEIECILQSKKQLKLTLNIPSWNKRVG